MKKLIKLHTKINLLIVMVSVLSISIMIAFITFWITDILKDKVKTNIMNTAEMVANSINIKEMLEIGNTNSGMGSYIDTILKSIDQVEYIIVADMQGIRYSHPNPQRIGEKFVGGDQYRVLKGETYISEATGTLGKSLRAFVPIYSTKNQHQIGFVSVGTLTQSIEKAKFYAIRHLAFISLIALGIGAIGAFFLSENIKQTMLGLEPEEITRLYTEKMSILDAIYEGLIAIDEDGKITLINDSALKIMQLKDKYEENELIGMDIGILFPTTRLLDVLQTGISEYDKEQRIFNTNIMTNRVPIKYKGKIVGAISTFRDKTEITNLAEELTGIKEIVDALRANTHEFMNKLHVILGLIHINELEEAKKYITNITVNQQEILSMIMNKIEDPTVAALILGKFSRAKELGVQLKINDCTKLESNHKNISSNTLITIIGNLIENAMEAVRKSEKEEKWVHVKIEESDETIQIEVKDCGVGIEDENIKRIFDKGYTTKGLSKGVGLALVKETVENSNGVIHVTSKINEGTEFAVILHK